MSWEWLNALVGRDVLSEKSVKAEVTGLMPSRPRASRRIGTSSEALRAGPRASRRIGTSSEASWHGSGLSPLRASPDICSRWAGWSSRASDVVGLPTVVFWFRYLQGLSNFFGSCLGYPFLWYLTHIYTFSSANIQLNRSGIRSQRQVGAGSRCSPPLECYVRHVE